MIDSLVADLGCDPRSTTDRLRRFVRLIIVWNRSVSNLISKNDEVRIVVRHLLESLEPARWLKEGGAERWLDFGTGAGFPAIPLAIAGVGRRWTLVESRRPKVLFLRKTLLELGMNSIDVVHSRLETMPDEPRDQPGFDGFTSRATTSLGATLALASKIVVAGGHAFLWKGSRLEEELRASSAWSQSWEARGSMKVGDGTSSVAMFIRK